MQARTLTICWRKDTARKDENQRKARQIAQGSGKNGSGSELAPTHQAQSGPQEEEAKGAERGDVCQAIRNSDFVRAGIAKCYAVAVAVQRSWGTTLVFRWARQRRIKRGAARQERVDEPVFARFERTEPKVGYVRLVSRMAEEAGCPRAL